jgi:hypothetical protein
MVPRSTSRAVPTTAIEFPGLIELSSLGNLRGAELRMAAGESPSADVLEDGLASNAETRGEFGAPRPSEVIVAEALSFLWASPTLVLLRGSKFSPRALNLGICKKSFSQVNRLRRGVGVASAHLH